MNSSLKNTDPYQWFFPMGFLFGMMGTGLWLAFSLHLIPWYPGIVHSEIMTSGFLMTVALGFLMTAIPRMTGTFSATISEKSVLALMITGLFFVSLFVADRMPFYALSALQIIFILWFASKRISRLSSAPPPSFVMAAFGLLGALAAHGILLMNSVHALPAFPNILARLLINHGLFLGLVLGAGSQLVPAFTGLKRTLMPHASPWPMAATTKAPR